MTERKIALIVVDVQEDFCPPNGSLAVPDGRAIVPIINELLSLPFSLKIATKDHHPPNHISFASNHGPSARPFETYATITNPANPSETYESRLWPDHCVIGTDPRVETYSAFRSPLKNPPLISAVSELAADLTAAAITDVLVVGLAGDYCVKCTALDSADQGWQTYIAGDGVRSVGGDKGWLESKQELGRRGSVSLTLTG
ncbi:Isochorismatase-like protein [Irpex lacteus]|nr:Isochorismatase-like protein [Irpex lacteus]